MPIGCSYADFIGKDKMLELEKEAQVEVEKNKEDFNETVLIDNIINKVSNFIWIVIKYIILTISIFIMVYSIIKYGEKYINPDELRTLFDVGIITIIILKFNIINLSGTFT